MTNTESTTTNRLELKARDRGFSSLAWLADNASQDPNRHVLNHILIDPGKEVMISTDGKKLAKAPITDALPPNWIAQGPCLLSVEKRTKAKLILQRNTTTGSNIFPNWESVFPDFSGKDAGRLIEVENFMKYTDTRSADWEILWTLLFRHRRLFFNWNFIEKLRFPQGPSETVKIRIYETKRGDLSPAHITGENGFEALLMPIRGVEEKGIAQ